MACSFGRNTYERNAADLFAVQSELADGIAANLRVAARAAPAAGHIPNAEAQDLMMKARYEVQQVTAESVARAESDFQRAIDLDPDYAAAYAGLGQAKWDQAGARGSTYQTADERQGAEKLFHKALALDPNLPTAHAALAVFGAGIRLGLERQAEREFQSRRWRSVQCVGGGHVCTFPDLFAGALRAADRHLRRAVELDPFFHRNHANNLALARNFAGASRRFARLHNACSGPISQDDHAPAVDRHNLHPGGPGPTGFANISIAGIPFSPDSGLRGRWQYASRPVKGKRALERICPFECRKYPNPGIPMQWFFALVYAQLKDEPNTAKWGWGRSGDRHEWQAFESCS